MANRRKGLTSTQELQRQTLRKASRNGFKWETSEVARIVQGIKADETTYEMAIALGRSYYGTQNTRRMVRFGMDHIEVLR